MKATLIHKVQTKRKVSTLQRKDQNYYDLKDNLLIKDYSNQ